MRNPRAQKAMVGQGIFMGLLILSLFYEVGKVDKKKLTTDPASRGQFVANLLGLSFMLPVNISMSSAQNVLLQLPMQAPVFRREKANRMYTTPAYFMGRLLSQILMQIWYPLIIIGILFYFLGINTEFSNLMLLLGYAVLLNVAMVC